MRSMAGMSKNRMEAFSDGVLAIIITIMVLEFSAPESAELSALAPLLPKFASYVLSFVFLGIYWGNHHHLLHAAKVVDGRVLWANLHLLFWLSLVPFATDWLDGSQLDPHPVAVYGVVLLGAAVAYFLLARSLIKLHGNDSLLATSLGRDRKGMASVAAYAVAIPLAFAAPTASCALYLAVALLWLIPDRRIAQRLRS